jgi:hypothetical protein
MVLMMACEPVHLAIVTDHPVFPFAPCILARGNHLNPRTSIIFQLVPATDCLGYFDLTALARHLLRHQARVRNEDPNEPRAEGGPVITVES